MGKPLGLFPTRRAFLLGGAALLAGCAQTPPGGPGSPPAAAPTSPTPTSPGASSPCTPPSPGGAASTGAGATDVAAQMSRTGSPVLCYHQIRPWAAGDSAYNKRSLICPPENYGQPITEANISRTVTAVTDYDTIATIEEWTR